MSGHSKWSQIKRQKGVADIKRGLAFTKMANAISIAVRQGGGVSDPEQNFKLRLEIEKARSINMPKENISRAIDRGAGKGDHEVILEEVVYEGFAPGGTAVIVEAVTDNKQRTTPEIKNLFEKNGATMGTPGAVSYQFQIKGLITAKKTMGIDDIFLLAADCGAEDVEEAADEVFIYTKAEDLSMVKEKLQQQLQVISAEIIRKPTITVSIQDREVAQKTLSFIEKLEDHADVQKVYANFDIPEELIATDTN